MKWIHATTTIALATSALSASLIEDAIKAGLAPIPATQAEIIKLVDNPKNPMTDEKVELGKMLYFDPRLSKSSLISCNTCHNLALGGDDDVPAAIGHKWAANPHHLNSPTVYNSVLNQVQFWDGRSPHLEDQAQGPMQAAPEMAAPKELVEKRITTIPEYVEAFKSAYGNDVKIDFEKIADTIAVFERTLITPSRFDEFLNGDENALNEAEKAGLKTFIEKGCVGCHSGVALGGTMQPFQIAAKYKFGNVGDFQGDANGMVKTPTLRNVEETAPYFHNGQLWTLTDAIKEMGSTQLGIQISDEDATSIETFLKTLTGEKPQIVYPILPPSTANTPKPDTM
jgi:cytochrome c peroxidase